MDARMAAPLPGWRFWLAWDLATVVAAIAAVIILAPLNNLALIAFEALGWSPASSATPGLFSMFVVSLLSALSGAIMGAAFGIGQWLVLRRVLPGTGGWVLATLIGYPLAFAVQRVVPCGDIPVLCGSMMFLLFGIALGVLQWLVLRGRVPRSRIWVAVSIAGWLLAFLLTGAVEVSGLYVEPFDLIAALLVPTMVTGAGMIWLLRCEPSKTQ